MSPHHTMPCGDVGGRATDGADSPVAAGWSDRARAMALGLMPGWLRLCVYKPGWLLLLPQKMGKRVSERATRGGEGRNTAVSGHRIHVVRLGGKPSGPVRTRRACFPGACGPGGWAVRRLVGDSAPRRWPAGSPAQWQSGRARRPRMWICVGPHDPDAKPSRGCLRVVELSAIPQLPT